MKIKFDKQTAVWLGDVYRTCALIFCNTLIFFVIINTIVALLPEHWSFKTTVDEQILRQYPMGVIAQAYPGYVESKIKDLLKESWRERRQTFEPYVQFKEKPTTGKYVNVSEYGFRTVSDQAAWPIEPENYNVFVYGGSTTFGYGLPDDQTIPAHLQKILRSKYPLKKITIYNFAAGNYFSSQERVLFEQHLGRGITPDLVIFIDGINDYYFRTDNPQYSENIKAYINGEKKQIIKNAIDLLPLKKFVSYAWIDSLRKIDAQAQNTRSLQSEEQNLSLKTAQALTDRYIRNKKMIEASAHAFGIPVLFVWQPHPIFYAHDFSKNPFAAYNDFGKHGLAKTGYEIMARSKTPGMTWCADVLEKITGVAFIDLIHYSNKSSELVSECVGRAVSGIIDKP